MTRIQGWIVIALLAIVAANILVIDIVVMNAMSSFAEVSSVPEMPTESVPTITCDTDPSCEEPTE